MNEATVMATANFLNQYLDMTTSLMKDRQRPVGFTYGSMDEFVKANGRLWPVAVNQDVAGAVAIYPQACFDNAFRLARRWPSRFRYVEGVALGVIPTHHAWCLNVEGEVVDPTWFRHSTVGSEYFGVEIPLVIAKQIRHRKNHSIIQNWEKGFPLFREPWPVVIQRNSVVNYK